MRRDPVNVSGIERGQAEFPTMLRAGRLAYLSAVAFDGVTFTIGADLLDTALPSMQFTQEVFDLVWHLALTASTRPQEALFIVRTLS